MVENMSSTLNVLFSKLEVQYHRKRLLPITVLNTNSHFSKTEHFTEYSRAASTLCTRLVEWLLRKKFSFRVMKVLELDSGDDCTTLKIFSCILSC